MFKCVRLVAVVERLVAVDALISRRKHHGGGPGSRTGLKTMYSLVCQDTVVIDYSKGRRVVVRYPRGDVLITGRASSWMPSVYALNDQEVGFTRVQLKEEVIVAGFQYVTLMARVCQKDLSGAVEIGVDLGMREGGILIEAIKQEIKFGELVDKDWVQKFY